MSANSKAESAAAKKRVRTASQQTARGFVSFRAAILGALAAVMFGPIIYNHLRLLTTSLPADQFSPRGTNDHIKQQLADSITTQGIVKGHGGHPLFVSTAGPTTGHPLLLVHGYPETALMSWRSQIPYFAKMGYHVIAPDLRGFNGSYSGDPEAVYNCVLAADDLKVLMDTVAPGRKACVVGHDWGAVPAWDYVIRNADRVACFMILDGPHPLGYILHILKRPSDLFLYSWYIIWDFTFGNIMGAAEKLAEYNDWDWMIKWWPGTANKGTFSEDDIEEYKQIWSRPGIASATLAWYRDIPKALFRIGRYKNTKVPWGGLSEDIPMTTLWGLNDPYLSPHLAVTTKYFAPHMKLKIIRNATHWIQHERPGLVNAELDRLLTNARWK